MSSLKLVYRIHVILTSNILVLSEQLVCYIYCYHDTVAYMQGTSKLMTKNVAPIEPLSWGVIAY